MAAEGGFLLQEDGVSHILLESGAGAVILEGAAPPAPGSGNLPFGIILPQDMLAAMRRRRRGTVTHQMVDDLDDETLAMILLDEL